MTELAEIVAGWPLAATMAAVAAAQGLRAGRRRSALNEALHELRRPLQAIALAGGGALGSPPVLESSVRLAAAALERLDHEVNGGCPATSRRRRSRCGRCWKPRCGAGGHGRASAGGSLDLRWRAGRAIVVGDRVELAQALDNLLVNAIEHGGPKISVDARPHKGRVRIVIADSGEPRARPRAETRRPTSSPGSPAGAGTATVSPSSGRSRRPTTAASPCADPSAARSPCSSFPSQAGHDSLAA